MNFWYIEKLTIFSTALVLILIGIAGKKCSLKIQKFISFPLIVSSSFFLSWFVTGNFWLVVKDVVIFGYNIEPFLFYPSAMFGPIIGSICGILIANKNLKIELKITFLNTITLLAGVGIGTIIGAIVLTIISDYLMDDFFYPANYCIVTLIMCLGGACGAIISHSKLLEKKQ